MNTDREKLLKEIRSVTSAWMGVSTVHGIANIARTRSLYIAILWLICLLASTIIAIYLTISSINKYMEFEKFNKYSVIYETASTFPSVTVCNINPFVTDKAFGFVENVLEKNNLKDFLKLKEFGVASTEAGQLFNNFMSIKYIGQIHAKNPNVSDAFKRSFGSPFEKFIIACFYGTVPCSSDHFTWYYDLQYGNCYTFNSGYNQNGSKINLRTSNKPGPFDGLILGLFVGVPLNKNALVMSFGAHVFIHNDSIQPTQFEGFDVAPGSQTNLIVKREFIDRLPWPYNECHDDLDNINAHDSFLFKIILGLNQTYRQRDCFRLCYQQAAIAECGCYDLNYPRLYNAAPCLAMDQLTCLYNLFLTYYESDIGSKCGNLCPLECDSVIYSVTATAGQFPSQLYAEYLMALPQVRDLYPDENVTYDLIKNTMLMVNVNFEETKYYFSTEEPSMNIIDLLANIGGTLGLFLGISFLSFAEIVEILLQVFLIAIRHESERRKKSSNPCLLHFKTSQHPLLGVEFIYRKNH